MIVLIVQDVGVSVSNGSGFSCNPLLDGGTAPFNRLLGGGD